MKYLKYASSTIKTYSNYIGQFLNSVPVAPTKLQSKHFQEYLDNYSFSSIPQQNQVISAIAFLYNKVLNKKYNKVSFERPRVEKKLPQVIEQNFLINKITQIHNLKHRAILQLAFSTGMRRSEVINLKLTDIDSARMLINIKQSKGKKDRVVPLSESMLQLLRSYFKAFKPQVYLFNGQNNLQYSGGSCVKLVKKYIGPKYSFHSLRHSSFTAMIENGTHLRIVQKIAGHASSKTTEVYTHVSNIMLNQVAVPM